MTIVSLVRFDDTNDGFAELRGKTVHNPFIAIERQESHGHDERRLLVAVEKVRFWTMPNA
jgi:hypothetical protein